MTQVEIALAAQENPFEGVLWFDWRYCECDDDENDAEWLLEQGIIDEDGNSTPTDWIYVQLPEAE